MDRPLAAELAWLDHLIHREALRLRATYALSLDEFRGIFVSDEQVDALLAQNPEAAPALDAPALPSSAEGPLGSVLDRFSLNEAERALLVLALAPELDGKYEALFAYLNNDAGRKAPTVDLGLRLLREAGVSRADLVEEATLFGSGLLEFVEEGPGRRTGLARAFAPSPALVRFVLGLEARLPPGLDWAAPAAAGRPLLPGLARVAELVAGGAPCPPVVLAGPPGSGRADAAARLAAHLDRPLLQVDLAAAEDPAGALAAASLLARIHGAATLVRGFEDLPPEDRRGRRRIAAALPRLPAPALVALDPASPASDALEAVEAVRVAVQEPGAEARRVLWRGALERAGARARREDERVLAERFRFGPAQIERAARAAALAARVEGPIAGRTGGPLPRPLLMRAARDQSGSALGALATRVPAAWSFADLILPEATIARVRAVAAAIANHPRVQDDWGLARLSGGGGLATLFQGPSGTGKTMTAGVIAGELGLDLYRIDLSGVVSKYIGETEKNLERIFGAARRANAVLLFDEADALFGKRSEVKDAHDRYANLEVAYLLQRMEEHDGPMILATNLARNLDQAFNRRLHHVVEFPRPDAAARERLWRSMLRPPLPLAPDVDVARLAQGFDLTGGEIRKAALEAAYGAAADGGVVTLDLLAGAASREARRQGRLGAGLPGDLP